MDSFERSAAKLAIGSMTDRELAQYEADLLNTDCIGWEQQEVIDLIRDEQLGREHDLSDPSSGLGVGPS